MIRTRLILLLAATALSPVLFSGAARAADTLSVRSGKHAGYTRMVFAWPQDVPYRLTTIAPGKLKLAFDKTAKLDTAALETGAGLNVKSVRQLSAGDAPLALEITVPPGSKTRDFSAGGKIIIDIYDTTEAKTAPVEPPAPKPAAIPPKPVEKAAPVKPAPKPVPKPEPTPVPVKTAPVPERPALEHPAPAVPAESSSAGAPDVITLSSTEKTGLAVFRTDSDLWIVADRAHMAVPPQLAGAGFGKGRTMKPVEVPGASAWRLPMPENAPKNVYVEGNGLIWRIVLTTENRADRSVEPERQYDAGTDDKPREGGLVWPIKTVTRVIDLKDPDTGAPIKVAAVSMEGQYTREPYSFVDLETLPSMAGLAILPHADDVKIAKTAKGIEASRPGRLALVTEKDLKRRMLSAEGAKTPDAHPAEGPAFSSAGAVHAAPVPAFFDFERWKMGGLQALESNQTVLLGSLKPKDAGGQAQDLLTLAKMNLANDRGPEALGFLNYAADVLPALADTPEFMALRGAAEAMSGKYELALQDLSLPVLTGYQELDYWRAYTLAWLEDWKQAKIILPADLATVLAYPQPLLEKMAPKFAEIALRNGDVAKAKVILDTLKKNKKLKPWTRAALNYLQGQADRQQKMPDEAEKLWLKLVKGKDDFYRVRAGLALNALQLEKGKITPDQAIDRLEGLRYGWRGDELETQINFALGKLYMQQRQFLKGFTILRDAASMNPNSDIAKDITASMGGMFTDLLLKDDKISAIEAMNIYEQFRELAPPGDDGNKIVQKLSDRLAATDLLGRAGDLLQSQIDYSLQGEERAQVAMRLAAIALLNKDPQRAFGALDKAAQYYTPLPAGADRDKHLRDINLMRARAISQQGKTEDALSLLAKMGATPQVSALRADIAWQAGLWPDAGDALQELILHEHLEPGKPLTDPQAALILNRAVALNLGGDRVELESMRQHYADRMKATARANMFEVVTRPHSIDVTATQPSLQGLVGDVDMFKGFLDDYKGVNGKTAPAAAAATPGAPALPPAK